MNLKNWEKVSDAANVAGLSVFLQINLLILTQHLNQKQGIGPPEYPRLSLKSNLDELINKCFSQNGFRSP